MNRGNSFRFAPFGQRKPLSSFKFKIKGNRSNETNRIRDSRVLRHYYNCIDITEHKILLTLQAKALLAKTDYLNRKTRQ